MGNKVNFEKHLEKLNRAIKVSKKKLNENKEIILPEGEDYDVDSLLSDVEEMRKELDETNLFMIDIDAVIEEMHDSKLHQSKPLEEEGREEWKKRTVNREKLNKLQPKNPAPQVELPHIHDPAFGKNNQYKTWEKGNKKINESMKIYNDQKKQSYKGENEFETFQRLMGYEIPKDKKRVQESAMWGTPKNLDRLVVLMDTQEAVLLKKENFDFNKLSEKNQMNASKAGHSLNVFDQLFETWYEYDKADFEKLI